MWEIWNCMESDITFVTFDKDHWKLIVGDHEGRIKIFDIFSGICIKEVPIETGHSSEISYISYAGDDQTIISCSWDKKIKIHKDGDVIELLW